MRRLLLLAIAVLTGSIGASGQRLALGSNPTLSAAERDAGWRLLFDGVSTSGWRAFNKATFPAGIWRVDDGWFKLIPNPTSQVRRADIITTDKFGDFDLRFEWRVALGGNSGVKYFVVEELGQPVAHEYQIIDDDRHEDAKVGPTGTTGALYDAIAPSASKPLRPAGQYNEVVSRQVV